ncbi:MAG: hypothetical protein DMD35_06680 [Gemmatimonadetes bacterium]|nr:MAG: hypothetical protein DMD35_06680 [Gemmatimonadota bacterium]
MTTLQIATMVSSAKVSAKGTNGARGAASTGALAARGVVAGVLKREIARIMVAAGKGTRRA